MADRNIHRDLPLSAGCRQHVARGLTAEGWQTAWGAYNVTYNRGLWFRTPEAYDEAGNFRASIYLRPLAIWAIERTPLNCEAN